MPHLGAIAAAAAKWAVASIDKDDVLRIVHHAFAHVADRSKNPTITKVAETVAVLSKRESEPAGHTGGPPRPVPDDAPEQAPAGWTT